MQGLPDFSADELVAWRTSALRGETRPSFVRCYSHFRPAPGAFRLEAKEERSSMHLMRTLVLLLKGAIYFETRKHYVVIKCTPLLF